LAGLLIHTSEGNGNGLGGRRTKRSGCEHNLARRLNGGSLAEVHHGAPDLVAHTDSVENLCPEPQQEWYNRVLN
jgi:hypothetical protein